MVPKDVHVLTPGTCEYDSLYGKTKIKVADGIQIAHQLTLKQGDYPGISGWTQCNHKIPQWKSALKGDQSNGCV